LVVEPVRKMATALDPTVSTLVTTAAERFHVPVLREDASADWLNEGQEITPTDGKFDTLTVVPAKIGGLSLISSELAHDSSPAAQQLVGQSLAESIARGLDTAFFGDESDPAPAGLAALTEYVAPDPGATPPVVEADGYSAVDPGTAYTSVDPFAEAIATAEQFGGTIGAFVTTPAVALTLAKIKDETGSNRPLLGVDATNGTARQILGVPLLVSPAVETGVVWGISANAAIVVMRDDVTLAVSTDAYFSSDRVAVRATMRVGFAFPTLRRLVKIVHDA
jgi:HK97 family phage major capsid protein